MARILPPAVADYRSHLSEIQPSADALQEVTLQSSNFAAEFGQVAGGLINITSRSGSNNFHGSGYEYFTNEALNAGRPYTDDGSGHLVRPRSRNNDFGFTVGGPVLIPKHYNGRDKTFFFFNQKFFALSPPVPGLTTVPTNAYRNGDFSGALTGRTLTDSNGRQIPEQTIFDPNTERVVNGQVIRDQFPGNIIPLSAGPGCLENSSTHSNAYWQRKTSTISPSMTPFHGIPGFQV